MSLYEGKTSELLALRAQRQIPDEEKLGYAPRNFLKKLGANLVGITLSTADSEFLAQFVMKQKRLVRQKLTPGKAEDQLHLLRNYFSNVSSAESGKEFEPERPAPSVSSSIGSVREVIVAGYDPEAFDEDFQDAFDRYFAGLIFADAFKGATED